MSIIFSAIAPHPPLLLPSVGAPEQHQQVQTTIDNLNYLGEKLKSKCPDKIIISSPHPDWGFNVPLHFLAKNFSGEIETILTGSESPHKHFDLGKTTFSQLDPNQNYALIASGDLSHCLLSDGPYGYHPQGPKFDQDLIDHLKNDNISQILELDNTYPQAGECGLRSFSFMLGMLKASQLNYQTNILSYQGPFGVGYLVAEFQL